jgi:hypothetical protein
MPRRQHWTELPADVRHEVERHTGPVLSAYPISDGSSCDLVVTLETTTRRVFCKGGEVGSPTTRLHRKEAPPRTTASCSKPPGGGRRTARRVS